MSACSYACLEARVALGNVVRSGRTNIEKGAVANCSGLLFSPDASKKVDEQQQDAEYYKKLSDELYKRRDVSIEQSAVLDKRLKLYMEQSHILAKQLYKKEKEDKWQKVIYFGMGVFATGIAVYGASKLHD